MTDKKNIALTIEATQTVVDLKQFFDIADQMDLIRLGFAYAIDQELDLDQSDITAKDGSNYTTGGLDSDGMMAEAVKIYYPLPSVIAEPYRSVEVLMNKGLLLLGKHRKDGVIGSISDLFETEDTKD